MKKFALLLIALTVLTGFDFPKKPAEQKYYTAGEKAKRGFLNIVTSPVEIARNIHNTTEEQNMLLGWTFGLAKGFGEGLLRFGAGAVDLLTFPFDFPDDQKAPIIEPEYVWEQPGPKYI